MWKKLGTSVLTVLEKKVLPDYFIERTAVAFGLGLVKEPESRRLFNFDNPEDNERWTTTCDSALGGLTTVNLDFTENQTAIFYGTIRRMPRRLIEIGRLRKQRSIIEENRERIRQIEAKEAEEAAAAQEGDASVDNSEIPQFNPRASISGDDKVTGSDKSEGKSLDPMSGQFAGQQHHTLATGLRVQGNTLASTAIGGASPHQTLPQGSSGLTRPGAVVRVEPHETSTISSWRAGYTAMRYKFPFLYNLDLFEAFEIKYRGDGRLYTLNVKPLNFSGRPEVYQLPLRTQQDKWMIARVPFTSMARTFRGYITEEQLPLDPNKMVSMSVVLKDDEEGDYKLEIDYIATISDMQSGNFQGRRWVSNNNVDQRDTYPY